MILFNKNKVNFYRNQCINLFGYDGGVKTIAQFCSKVNNSSKELGEELSIDNYTEEYIKDRQNVLKGDLFEIFSELFFNGFPTCKEVGLRDYSTIDLADDYGVDAVGVNTNGDDVVVQIKYRSDPTDQIDLASIARTYTSGKLQLNKKLENKDTIFLLTTCTGATSPCHIVFGNKLRVINKSVIAGKMDNDDSFWKKVEADMSETFLNVGNNIVESD